MATSSRVKSPGFPIHTLPTCETFSGHISYERYYILFVRIVDLDCGFLPLAWSTCQMVWTLATVVDLTNDVKKTKKNAQEKTQSEKTSDYYFS